MWLWTSVRNYRNFHLFLLGDKLDKPEIADPAYEALLEGMSISNIQEIETDRLLHYATILSLRREERLEVLELYLKEIALRTDVVDDDLVSSLRTSTSAELKESHLGN